MATHTDVLDPEEQAFHAWLKEHQAIGAEPADGTAGQADHTAYKGGSLDRLYRAWMPAHRSGDTAIGENWNLLTSRIRDLFRNEPVMKNLRRALAKHVIGTGICTFADVMSDPETPDDIFNDESDDLFETWSEEEADVEGRLDWAQMQWMHFCEVMESGESFLLKCIDPDPARSLPLCYQLLEPEQLDESRDQRADASGNKIVRGIEYNKRGQAVAYYFFDAHPYDTYTGYSAKSERIPAERVIHSFLPNRSSENRGVTWFACNVQSSKDLDWYLGNEMTAAALGALLTLIVKRKNGAGMGLGFAGGASSSPGDTDVWGNSLVKLGRGTVADIGPDDEVTVAESKRPNRDAAPFIKLILMLQSMGVGISQLRATGDYSQSSYTSARGAHLDDQAFFAVLQKWASRSFIKPVRKAHTIQAAGYGLFESVSPRQFKNSMRKMLRTTVQPPGREQLDPEMETKAAGDRISGLFSTWREECGLRGRHWRRVAIQQKRERDYFKSIGLEPQFGTTPPAARGDDRSPPTSEKPTKTKPAPAPADDGEED